MMTFFFCITKVAEFNKKAENHIIYPNILSVIRPDSHSDGILVPRQTKIWEISPESDTSDTSEIKVDYELPTNENPKLFN